VILAYLLSTAAPCLSCQAADYVQVAVPLPGQPAKAPAPAPSRPVEASTDPVQQSPAPKEDSPPAIVIPIGTHGRPDINPYERDINMTVPLMYRDRSLGDMDVRLTFDDRLLVESKAFGLMIGPLLNDATRSELAQVLAAEEAFSPDDLERVGVALVYDPASLAVVVLNIEAARRAPVQLFAPPSQQDEVPDLKPAGFSAYLNINAFQLWNWDRSENKTPSLNLNGAARLGGVVFEGDVALRPDNENMSNGYRFERNYARLVYDEPTHFRRWILGDLTPEVRGQQGFVQLGGLGVVRGRQRFNEFRSAILQGNRQLLLQQDSTVRIMRNGVLYQEVQLDAGSYDLSSLPLINGSNDVSIEIRDGAGRVQSINYEAYLDPIDLEPGDYEYAAYIGPIGGRFGGSPKYNGPLAFTGYFRKAFLDRPAIGIGLQLSKEVQNLTGQTQFVVGNGSRLLLDGGLSRSKPAGAGFAAGVAYDQIIDRSGLVDSFSLRADYLSRNYSTLGNPTPVNSTMSSITAQYGRTVTRELNLVLTGSYVVQRDRGDSYRFTAQANYRISPKWSIRTGVEYSHTPSFASARGFGASVALVFQPNYRTRAEARYDSSIDSGSLSYLRAGSGRLDSFGYGATVNRDGDYINASSFVDYTGNRFDASASHSVAGRSFGSIGNENRSTLRVGTTLAFADGALAFGRRISDSFAILEPHRTLKKHTVVAGDSIEDNSYLSASGPLGGALNNGLSSYVPQSIQYDVKDPPPGYDIGPGVYRVKPGYRSGYRVTIGTDAFVTAMGTFVAGSEEGAKFLGGRVVAISETGIEPVPFFTNSIGRFAVGGLRPGVRYRVESYQSGATVPLFEFSVPTDNSGLLNLGDVKSPSGK
jgi:outer membrane usher protein